MARRPTAPLVAILRAPHDDAAVPLHKRIGDAIRTAVARGTLRAGSRLPSTRALAGEIGVSRTTVEAAFALLDAEGLLIRRVGVGSFVSKLGVVRERPPRRAPPPPLESAFRPPQVLSARGRALVEQGGEMEVTQARSFTPCIPSLDAFPFSLWNRILARRARSSATALARETDPAGLRALREAVATHVASSRGVRCTHHNVLIATSTQQLLDLCSRVLLDPGDPVWLEEPGYLGARGALRAAGAEVVPVPVDAEGLSVEEGTRRAPHARFAYVTPSYQYPLGITMSSRRRAELLNWARRAGAWIFEDDYDGEFRFLGRPLAAIKGHDAHDHVLYAATFNKIMFPSLRLAYLVAPRAVIDVLVTARTLSDGPVAALTQAAMAEFMTEGHFAAHVRTTRACCEERRDALLDSIARELPHALSVPRTETGTHCVGWLPADADSLAISGRALENGLDIPPLSRYFIEAQALPRPGLVICYAAATPAEIRAGIRVLATCM